MTFALGTLLSCLSASANSADRPTAGIVYSAEESASLYYTCSLQSNDELTCEFLQTRVRKKLTEGTEKTIEKALKDYRDAPEKLSNEVCRGPRPFHGILDILEGRKAAPEPNKLAQMPDFQKRDAIDTMKTIAEFCDAPSLTKYRRLLEVGLSKETRTCAASSQKFTQTFKRVSDYSSKTHTWVVKSEPTGACGLVDLSRFEAEQEATDKTPLVNWKYFDNKSITNRKGKGPLGISCSDLDEKEYEFGWKWIELPLKCDYIEFSVF